MNPIACPECKAKLAIKQLNAKREIRCPKCGHLWIHREPDVESRFRAATPMDLFDSPREVEYNAPPSKAPWLIAAVLVMLGLGGGLAWYFGFRGKNDQPAETAKVDDKKEDAPSANHSAGLLPEKIYYRLLRSTAVIASKAGVGSSSLVHPQRKLLLTNAHVVGQETEVKVFFPAFASNEEVIVDPVHYFKNHEKTGLPGKVLHRDPVLDLAIVQLESLPPGTMALPLSIRSAKVGETVYSVGGSGIEALDKELTGTMWRFSTGPVRSKQQTVNPFTPTSKRKVAFLENQKPINPGDSGGPTVNANGAIVAVVCMKSNKDDLVALDVDVSEVREFLSACAKKDGWEWNLPAVDSPVPTVAEEIDLAIRDMESGDAAKIVAAGERLKHFGTEAKRAQPAVLKALVGAESEPRAGLMAVLEAMGPIGPTEEPHLLAMLKSPYGAIRGAACRIYAKLATPSSAAVPMLAAELQSPERATRLAALAALKRHGPAAKAASAERLLFVLDTADEAFASEAQAFLDSFTWLATDDNLLIGHIRKATNKPPSRLYAARKLASIRGTSPARNEVWHELLKDSVEPLRLLAVKQHAPWPKLVQSRQKQFLEMARKDHSVPIRVEALITLRAGVPAAEYFAELQSIAAEDAAEEVRTAAAESLVGIDLGNLTLADLKSLCRRTPPPLRVRIVNRFAAMGTVAATALPEAMAFFEDHDAERRLAVVRFAVVLGPKAESCVPRFAQALADAGTTGDVKTAIVKALPVLGPPGRKAVVAALSTRQPEDVMKAVLQTLPECGAEAKEALPALFRMLEDEKHLDVLPEALGKLADEAAIERLLKKIYVGVVIRPELGEVHAKPAIRCAALKAFGFIDYKKVPKKKHAGIVGSIEVVTKSPKADPESKQQAGKVLAEIRDVETAK